MVDYSKCLKDLDLKLRVYLQSGKVLTKNLKIDVNDGVEARLLQIQEELIEKMGSQTFSFFAGKREIKILEEGDLDKEYLDSYSKIVEDRYNALLESEKCEIVSKLKKQAEENKIIENLGAPVQETLIQENPAKETLANDNPVQNTPGEENLTENATDYEKMFEAQITEAMKNRFWTDGLDLKPYVITNPPSQIGGTEQGSIYLIRECRFSNLIQSIGEELVLNVTVTDNVGNKNLRIAQTFDQVTVYSTADPALKFTSTSTVLLRAISLFGPRPKGTEFPGFNFEMIILNQTTKQETFCICSCIGGLPKHQKFFLREAILINSGDQIDIRPIIRRRKVNDKKDELEKSASRKTKITQMTPAQKNKFVADKQTTTKPELDFNPEVTEGYGQVYLLFSQTGIVFGQDGVRFELQNRDNIGISGIYYESLSEQQQSSMKQKYESHTGQNLVSTEENSNPIEVQK